VGEVTEQLIDLGVLGEGNDVVEWGPPPARMTSSSRWPAVTAVLVLVALFTASSIPADTVAPVASLPTQTLGFNADADNLYAVRDNPSITAYDWRAGAVRWTRDLSDGGGQLYLAAGRPFVRHSPCTRSVGWSLESLDPVSGRPRWTHPGGVLAVLAGKPSPSLLTVNDPGAACPITTTTVPRRVPPDQPMRLSAMDVDTGATRWEFTSQGGRIAVPDAPGASWFALWFANGHAEVHDAATGGISASAELPELEGGIPQSVRLVGDLMLIVTAGIDGAMINAYHRKDLTLAWRKEFHPSPPAPITELAYGPSVSGCGPMICVPDWRDTVVIDPSSGQTLWQRDVQLDEDGPGVVVARQRADFLHERVVDWRTGKDLVDLPGWGAVPMVSDDSVIGPTDQPSLTLVQHPEGAQAQLAAVDLQTGQVTALGTVSPMPSRCAIEGRRLACLAGDESIHIWRLPASTST
jgi:hypothetical protein